MPAFKFPVADRRVYPAGQVEVRKPGPLQGRRWEPFRQVVGDISHEEIERRYQAALAVIRYERYLAQREVA